MIAREDMGGLIRELRLAKHLSVLELARLAELPRNTIYRIEEGKSYPRIDTLDILLKALNYEYILGGKTNEVV